jgi:ABC-type phosphate transport system permease subunit
MAIRADQVGLSGAFGAVPVFAGTLLISAIAMAIAVPIGLMSAIYVSEYAGKTVRNVAKPLMEILAGIPTVVYGFFAALVVAPAIRGMGRSLGTHISSESALAAGSVMGIMIIPFVSSLSDDMINAVPQALRDGAYGRGATQSETIREVSLDIDRNEVISIIGPSGCGKSTCLRCLNRMNDTIDGCRVTGTITLNETNIAEEVIYLIEGGIVRHGKY